MGMGMERRDASGGQGARPLHPVYGGRIDAT
jgi:hypothetical protein